MPKYTYFCKECEEIFEIKHSLQETCIICTICEYEGSLERRPSAIFIGKKDGEFQEKNKAGELVKARIEEGRIELKQEQENLKTREYKK